MPVSGVSWVKLLLAVADRGVELGFVDDTALILYVYLPNDEDGAEESCLTVGADDLMLGALLIDL